MGACVGGDVFIDCTKRAVVPASRYPRMPSRSSTLAVMRAHRAPANGKVSLSVEESRSSKDTRSGRRARCKGVFTVSGRIVSNAAVSSMLMLSTSRMMKTTRNRFW
jgi:hypothetical protein